jgi:hypothetical protein
MTDEHNAACLRLGLTFMAFFDTCRSMNFAPSSPPKAGDGPTVRRSLWGADIRDKVDRLISNVVIFAIVGGTLTATVLKKEFWPFSPFPMYSVTEDYRKPYYRFGVFGLVENDGKLTEVSLNRSELLYPIDRKRLAQTLGSSKVAYNGRMWGAHMEISDEFYRRKLLGVMKLYNRNLKRSPDHKNEAPLVGMRLYMMEYPDRLRRPVPLRGTKVNLIAELRNDE